MAELTRYRGWIIIEPHVYFSKVYMEQGLAHVNTLFLSYDFVVDAAALIARPIAGLAEVITAKQRTTYFVIDKFTLKLDPVLKIWKSVIEDG